MNYYPFHIGDYTTHTAHLEPLEDLAFRRLMDAYYLREAPLPADTAECARLIRMKAYLPEVEAVLKEFFDLTDEGWFSVRCNEEIVKAKERSAQANEKDAHERDRMARHRKRRAEMFAALRERGVVPAWDVSMKELQQVYDQTCNAPETRTAEKSNGYTNTNPNTNPNSYSEANASGGKPPMTTDEIIFAYGVPLLVNAGSTDKAARSFLGGLRKNHGDVPLVNALRDCIREKPIDPLSWLAKCLPPKGVAAKPSKQAELEARNRAVAQRWAAGSDQPEVIDEAQ